MGTDGTARLTTHLEGAAGRPVQVRRSEGANVTAEAPSQQTPALHQRQVRLASRGVVTLAASRRSVRTELVDQLIVLTAVTSDGVEFHDVTAPDGLGSCPGFWPPVFEERSLGAAAS